MALDLYAGSLAKYYSRDWETPIARLARENGWSYQTAYSGDVPDWLDRQAAQLKVSAFIANLEERSRRSNGGSVNWNDNIEHWIALQLHRQCLDALILVAAYLKRTDLVRPMSLPKSVEADPAYAEAAAGGYYNGILAILEAQMFIPAESHLFAIMKDPMGWDLAVTTTRNLRDALAMLNKKNWNSNAQVETWLDRGPPEWGASLKERSIRIPWKSEFKQSPVVETVNLMHCAEYGFAVFSSLLNFAEEHKVAIRHDA